MVLSVSHSEINSEASHHWIDSHCHLDFPEFADRHGLIVQACRKTGMQGMIVPGVEARFFSRQKNIQVLYPEVKTAYGLHPWFKHSANDLARLEAVLESGDAVAVGEFGLDAIHTETAWADQEKYCRAQFELAQKFNLPVILHVVKAHDQMIRLIKKTKPVKCGVIHGFYGSEELAKAYVNLGFSLGIGGAITWPRSEKLRQAVAGLPKARILLETDAPAMRPAGWKNQPNTPENIPLIAKAIASLRQETMEEVFDYTLNNSKSLFAL